MTGERHFAIQTKDANADVDAGSIGGENERALGEVHLARDASHVVGCQSGRIDEDRELVAAERGIAEDIVVKIAVRATWVVCAEPSK
jgi:hypothetical protein